MFNDGIKRYRIVYVVKLHNRDIGMVVFYHQRSLMTSKMDTTGVYLLATNLKTYCICARFWFVIVGVFRYLLSIVIEYPDLLLTSFLLLQIKNLYTVC